MRKALNENPKVQAAVVGVLALVVVAIFMMNSGGGGGGGDDAASAPPPSAPPTSSGVEPATGSDLGTESDAAGSSGAGVPTSSETPMGPPLPAPVRRAYDQGDTIALLVVRQGGVEDEAVADALGVLKGEPNVSTFVVPTERIAAYARITQGVGVTRAPALVVVRPRRMGGGQAGGGSDDDQAVAQVHYGYREPSSVLQAVRDASQRSQPATYGP